MFFSQIKKFSVVLIYSFGVCISGYLAAQSLYEGQTTTGTLALFGIGILIIVSDIFINFVRKSRRVEINLDFNDKVNEFLLLINNFLLPISLFIGYIGFIHYNIVNYINLPLIILNIVVFSILFINIRAFFLDDKREESKTHFVYDIIKFLIFFYISNILSHLSIFFDNLIPYAFALFIITYSLMVLMMWKLEKLHKNSLFLSFVGSVFIVLIFAFIQSFLFTNSLQISLALLFIFYITTAIIHHVILKTLQRNVLIEYFAVMLVVLAVLYGIN